MEDGVLIFGATSRIAECTARIFAEQGRALLLVARDEGRLTSIRQDLLVRGAKSVQCFTLNLSDLNALENFFVLQPQLEREVSVVLVAHGVLPDQQSIQDDFGKTRAAFEINLLSPILISIRVLPWFEKLGRGTLAVITSVAGDRGRQSNYIYGASKGGLSLFLQGLRNRVGRTAIRVLDIRPGFVDTPMTAHLKKGPLFASAEQVAGGIVAAIQSRWLLSEVVYLPWFWRFILGIIKLIPETVFKKLKL